MNILITNIWLVNPGGTEVYVRDLAIELHKRGNHVEIYSPKHGLIAQQLKDAGIFIVDSVNDLKATPDIIHAHHFLTTMDAIFHFPETPVVYFQHDRSHPADTPPLHRNIVHYVAIDYNCLDRLVIDAHIEEKDCAVIYNWVDSSRFKKRKEIAVQPRKALMFSNYANDNNYYKVVKEACLEMGLEIEGIGVGFGNATKTPEDILEKYDIVFAKAKAAMEALATGAAVIICDFNGLGGMVTLEKFDHFRKFNFGMRLMNRPHEKDLIVEEIKKYNSSENEILSQRIKEEANFLITVDKIFDIYHATIQKYNSRPKRQDTYEEKTLHDYLVHKIELLNEQHQQLLNPEYPFREAVNKVFSLGFKKLFGKK